MWLRIFPHAETESIAKLALFISLAIVLGWLNSAPAGAGDLVVRYDQSQLLRLPRPATEIIIGNPSIADVALQGGNLLVVTGKTFGITNVIALDSERNVIQDQRVIVERDDRRIVNLHKGGSRYTYSCTPNCEPNLTIGDDETFFTTINKHNGDKTRFSESSADSAGAGANSQ
ncbi:MAG: pilus assembly protein N-terminal domain-containing protein [Hyphomicrobium sp.]